MLYVAQRCLLRFPNGRCCSQELRSKEVDGPTASKRTGEKKWVMQFQPGGHLPNGVFWVYVAITKSSFQNHRIVEFHVYLESRPARTLKSSVFCRWEEIRQAESGEARATRHKVVFLLSSRCTAFRLQYKTNSLSDFFKARIPNDYASKAASDQTLTTWVCLCVWPLSCCVSKEETLIVLSITLPEGLERGVKKLKRSGWIEYRSQMILILILFVLKLTYNLFGKNRRGIYEFLVLFLIIVISYKAMAFVYSGFGGRRTCYCLL